MLFISISSGYTALSIPFVGFALYVIQQYYLRTSKQIRLMDLEAKAPLYAHFTESASGLATLRAFGWTRQAMTRNEELLTYSQKPFYLLYAVQRWLGLVLDLLVAGVATVTVGIAVGLHGKVSGGWIGVALVNIITLSEELNSFVVSWTNTEASMGSIARIKAIHETLSAQSNSHSPEPPSDWPSTAAIEFSHVNCSGDNKGSDILSDISLSIYSGEKIGICGRTGSGKSTLIGLLFRFNDPAQGTVTIDGLNLSNVDPETLRTRIIGVAQEASIVQGTVRANLPKRSDFELIAALEQFKLWQIFESRGGLDCKLIDLTLSHGQKQLFCFVRAYISNSRLLVLDEATSSMTEEMEDAVTNALLQDKKRTVIAVAHRLRSITAFDRIIVLKEGRILEVGTPEELLSKPDGEFSQLSKFDAARTLKE
jgi:ABC-type multidrug transport system fused ATPase/permease subunit